MAADILLEFLEDNVHRAYPFNTNSTIDFPTSILTDGLFLVAGVAEHDNNELCVSRIIGTDTAVSIYLSVYSAVDDTVYALDNPIHIPKVSDNFNKAKCQCVSADNNIRIDCTVVTGLADAVNAYVGDSGELKDGALTVYSGCVAYVDTLVHRLIVNDVIVTGDLNIVADDGIDITPSIDDAGVATLRISVSDYVPDDNMEITTDAELLDNVLESIGTPITSINNVYPVDGNISIQAANADSLSVATIAGADGLLTIDVPSVVACASDIQAAADAFISSVNNLNARQNELKSFYNSLESALNFINQQLAQLR